MGAELTGVSNFRLCKTAEEVLGVCVHSAPEHWLIVSIFIFILLVAVRPFCAPWAYLNIISGAGVVSGTPHPAV